MNKNSTILWQSGRIMAIATGLKTKSTNSKTGGMVQTYILRSDMHPVEAIATGKDKSICGDCPLRGTNGKDRPCYVQVSKAPAALWRGKARFAGSIEDAANRPVRLGAYGDPSYVPMPVWHKVLDKASGWTGYTHQWRNPLKSAYKALCMASVETLKDKEQAKAMGWRTFRIIKQGEPLQSDEVLCPASVEAGKRTTCEQCKLCSGTSSKAKSVAIHPHGNGKKRLKLPSGGSIEVTGKSAKYVG